MKFARQGMECMKKFTIVLENIKKVAILIWLSFNKLKAESHFDEEMGLGTFSQIWYYFNETKIQGSKSKQLKLTKFLSD